MESTDLNQLEEKVSREYDRDGAIECLVGIALIIGGINLASGGVYTTTIGLLPIFVLLLAKAWKKKITYPRLGYVELQPKHRERRKRAVLLMVVAVLCATALLLYFESAQSKLTFGFIVAGVLAAIAAIRRMTHLYYFAVFAYGMIILCYLLNLSAGYAILTTGALLLILGFIRLSLFLRANPRVEGDLPVASGR